MGERKVLNKYYPPDFNPDKLIKNKRPKDKQDNVRMMLPMSLRCNTCGNYLYIGTKFNMRKETVLNEDYLGIRIYRFYMKCTRCYAEITMKTDPKNHDYIVEHGGTRNYEPWRDAQAAEATLKEMREEEEEGNAMKFLEHKTYDSKKEMDILDALDEIRHMNKRKAQVTHEQILKIALENQARKLMSGDGSDEEDENISIAEYFKNARIKRLEDDYEEEVNMNGNYQITKPIVKPENQPAVENSKGNKHLPVKILPVKKVKPSSDEAKNLEIPKCVINESNLNINNGTLSKNKEDKVNGIELKNKDNQLSSSKDDSKPQQNKSKNVNLCGYSDDDD